MKVSATEKGTWYRCARQHQITSFNHMGLTNMRTPVVFLIGTTWHRGMEYWVKDPSMDAHVHMGRSVAEEITSTRDRFIRKTGIKNPPNEIFDDITKNAGLLITMAKNYQDRWKTPLPDGYTPIQVEQTIVVPIPESEHFECKSCQNYWSMMFWTDPDLCKPSSRPSICAQCTLCTHSKDQQSCWLPDYYEGKLDGLVRYERTGEIFVLERKTFGRHPNMETLMNNEQFLDYCWLVVQAGIADIDLMGGILYDGAYKREEPAKGKPWSDLFVREVIKRKRYEIENHTESIRYAVEKMRTDPYAHNFEVLHPLYNRMWSGCSDCKVQDLCVAYNTGKNSWEVLRDSRYTQREKAGYADDSEEEVA